MELRQKNMLYKIFYDFFTICLLENCSKSSQNRNISQ